MSVYLSPSKKKQGTKNGNPESGKVDGEDEKENLNPIEAFRLKLKKNLSTTLVGRAYTAFLMSLGVISCLQYIYQTYLDERDPADATRLQQLSILELLLAAIFLFDWCLCLFIADNKYGFFRSFFSMIDLLTIIPTAFTYGTVCPSPYELYTSHDCLVYLMNMLTTTRTLRILRIHRYLVLVEDPVARKLGNMAMVIFAMLIFDSCLMMFLELPDNGHFFHTWIYYSWVTICTVGYGDISPQTTRGRFFFMILISFAILIVPMLTNELFDVMKKYSEYARAFYQVKRRSSHIIITGDISSCSLREFFGELFHEDHENAHLKAVILLPTPPTFEVLEMLKDPLFSLNVTYLEGSALIDRDLKRACAEYAGAVFILTNKFSATPDEEDARTILLQLSITRYTQQMRSVHLPFCKQLIRPENRKHIKEVNVGLSDLVICINEIKMGMFAKSALFPGTNALILNLTSSFADDVERKDEEKDELEIDILDDCDEDEVWIEEYKSDFNDAPFCILSNMLYHKLGIILFGLQITELTGRNNSSRIILNPGNFKIPRRRDDYLVEGLVIAENKTSSDLSMEVDDVTDLASVQRVNDLAVIAKSISKSIAMKRNVKARESKRSKSIMFVRMKDMLSPQPKNLLILHSPNAPAASANTAGAVGERKINKFVGCGDSMFADEGTQEKDGSKKTKYTWQTMLKRQRFDSEDAAFEVMQKLEEQNLRSNFFVRKPMDLSLVTIKTSVLDEIPLIYDHILIVGRELLNLADLIRPLRARYLGRLTFIVILSPDMPHSIWQKISIYEGIVFVRGSPIEANDLRRAGIYRAQQVIIVADPSAARHQSQGLMGMQTSGMNKTSEALADVDAIFSYQVIKKMNERANLVIEIVNIENIGFLELDATEMLSSKAKENYKFTPQFASGMLFTSSLLDTLVCQSFYNPNIVRVVNKLIGGMESKGSYTTTKEGEEAESVFDGVPQLDLNKVTSSCLYQIPIPENLEPRTFGSLFKYLSNDNMIPLAILRGTFTHLKLGPLGNKMPYVFTNPNYDSELFSCDKIFVLSQNPLTLTKLQTFIQTSNDIKEYEEKARSKIQLEIKDEFHEEFVHLHNHRREMENIIESLSEFTHQSFADLSMKLKSAVTKEKMLQRTRTIASMSKSSKFDQQSKVTSAAVMHQQVRAASAGPSSRR